MDIETTDILTMSHTHLAEDKSHGLTCTLIHEAIQAGKSWDEIKSILRLKLCNENIHTYTSCFMEIQQKDIKTLAAYIHCFKSAAKQCTFHSDTVAICSFVKGIWDAHTATVKIHEKHPQTLSEVIRLVAKLNAALKLTATLTPSKVSMMSNDDRCFVCRWMAVLNLATLHRPVPKRILPQGHDTTKTDLIQGIDISTPKGTDHTPPTMVTDRGDISADHHPTAVPTVTGAAVSKSTHHPPHPTTAAAQTALQLMDAPIAICAMTHPIITSPDITHITFPWTGASLGPATPTALHRKHSEENPSHAQDHQSHHSKTVIIQDSPTDSSSDSDSNSDPLNYYRPLPVVMKINREGNLQAPIMP